MTALYLVKMTVFPQAAARILLLRPALALRKLSDDERKPLILNEGLIDQGFSDNTPGTSLNPVNEPGLYSLILRSRKPEAEPFRRWVTHEVLPEIRKTGRYAVPLCAPYGMRDSQVSVLFQE